MIVETVGACANHSAYCASSLQVAVFDDMDKAIAFRRHFPHWEVRCVIVLPRYTPNGKNMCNALSQNKLDARQSPTAVTMKPTYTLELSHPLLAVPATANMMTCGRKTAVCWG